MAIRTPRYKIAPEGAEYALTLASGALTVVAAAGPVFSFRWTNTEKAAIIRSVFLSASVTTAYTTAQATEYGLYFARSFTAADTGGLAATLTTNNGKKRTSFASTLVGTGDIRIGDTGVVTAGTRTLDAHPLSVWSFGSAALASAANAQWFFGMADDREPLILRAEEGIVIHNLVTMSAVGVLKLYVGVEWAEVHTSAL